ncbi:MAG: CPBP family intramembrane metalloprotease [Candidatus Competibacteraceae bacterium]|nr:CPBP family intramembrane metalloprotease [Candidatus Competibacteraceae bacterium]
MLANILASLSQKTFFPFSDHLSISLEAVVTQLILSPVNEELLFRGIFLSILLLKPYPPVASVFLSATIFSACHNLTSLTLISTFTQGLLYGSAFKETRSIIFCTVLHIFWMPLCLSPLLP